MAEPIVEQIAAKIKTALETITTANGYNQTVAEVVRPTRLGGVKPENNLLVLQQGDPVRDDDANTPHMYLQWIQPFTVDCFIIPSDKSETAVETAINRIRADVEKVARANAQWDSLALDTRIGDPMHFPPDAGAFDGVRVVLEVLYRTLEDDPYAQI